MNNIKGYGLNILDTVRIESLLIKSRTCGYCGHQGNDVNHYGYEYTGGRGEVPFPVCDNAGNCISRIEVKRG